MGESDQSKPGTDDRVRELRERAVDLLAGASLHAERIHTAAEKLGLTPDLLDGLGDQLYDAAVAQLDVASKILERSQLIADRLIDLGVARVAPSRLERVDVTPGSTASLRFSVRNTSSCTATVEVEPRPEWDGPGKPTVRIGREQLPGDRETSVEISIPTRSEDRNRVFAGTVCVRLRYETGRAVELPRRDFEVWVVGGG